MNIRRLKPKASEMRAMPQCDAEVPSAASWSQHYINRRATKARLMGWNPDLCTRASSIHIEGRNYCGQHGGQVAIAILLGEKPDFTTVDDAAD